MDKRDLQNLGAVQENSTADIRDSGRCHGEYGSQKLECTPFESAPVLRQCNVVKEGFPCLHIGFDT